MKIKNGFTLIEFLIVFILFGIIASIVTSASRLVVDKTANSKMTYAIFMNLKRGVGEYISEKGVIENSGDLCRSLVDTFNVIGSTDCPAADGSVDASSPNFKIKNGAVFYNFGSLPITSEGSTYYQIYVDIDGTSRRGGFVDEDVVTFLINKYGEVLPLGIAATNVQYLNAGYKFLKTVDVGEGQKNSTWEWARTNLSYKDAICKSGIKLQTTNYCSGITVDSTYCNQVPCQLYIYH